MARRTAALLLLTLAAGPITAVASDTALSGLDGHPRSRFPLAVHAPPTGEAALDAEVARAITDWNATARAALGVDAFARGARESEAQVSITFPASGGPRLMGVTFVSATDGVIDVPVRIEVVAPQARGTTSRERVFYQVLAHELGHALGLPHVAEPRSLMCCVAGQIDLDDPATRAAYVEARRHPDIGSVRAQLAAHYERIWRRP